MTHHARIDPLIDRLHRLHPRLIDLGLDRLQRLLAAMGHPERRLPPVLHVGGTNGKGSTCAMLRAMAEASGARVHVFTSPHLVRFNERFRISGQLVSDGALADALEHVEQVNDGAAITVFEVITAAAFHLFAGTPADLCVLEVGLGGRGDATNVIEHPAACAIASLSLDHQDLLGDTLAQIATEKAGIFKPGAPAVTVAHPAEAMDALRRAANGLCPLLVRGEAWDITATPAGVRYWDGAGVLDLPAPGMLGAHQVENAGLALATLRAARLPHAPAGLAQAHWPARLQRLLHWASPHEVWLDGGHNPGAGLILAAQAVQWADRPFYLIVGMKQAKDAPAFLRPLLPHAAGLWAVQEPGQHLALPVEAIVAASGGIATPGPTVAGAMAQLAGLPPGRVLICGSLYLAGEVLKVELQRQIERGGVPIV